MTDDSSIKNQEERIVSALTKEGEVIADVSVRPRQLSEYIGQHRVKDNLLMKLQLVGFVQHH